MLLDCFPKRFAGQATGNQRKRSSRRFQQRWGDPAECGETFVTHDFVDVGSNLQQFGSSSNASRRGGILLGASNLDGGTGLKGIARITMLVKAEALSLAAHDRLDRLEPKPLFEIRDTEKISRGKSDPDCFHGLSVADVPKVLHNNPPRDLSCSRNFRRSGCNVSDIRRNHFLCSETTLTRLTVRWKKSLRGSPLACTVRTWHFGFLALLLELRRPRVGLDAFRGQVPEPQRG
mmetsp:Transcript_99871/g.149611  ORF Transcript_99871/g.149611 Transcript_99871/m.149611 type:complete len:233 (+) Transcript_99871:574-1272(+)